MLYVLGVVKDDDVDEDEPEPKLGLKQKARSYSQSSPARRACDFIAARTAKLGRKGSHDV